MRQTLAIYYFDHTVWNPFSPMCAILAPENMATFWGNVLILYHDTCLLNHPPGSQWEEQNRQLEQQDHPWKKAVRGTVAWR